MPSDFVISSESVTAAHPDKLCDQISDAIVDRHLRQDEAARVAAECAISTGILFISIKAQSAATVDTPSIARSLLGDVGYEVSDGFDPGACTVVTSAQDLPAASFPRMNEELLDDDAIDRLGARDQATVFGFACRDTPSGLPLPIWIAHRLSRRMAVLQREAPDLSPDGKAQVAIEYRDNRPVRVHGITLIACQRKDARPSPRELEAALRAQVVEPVFAELALKLDERTRFAVNPEGPLVPGGPVLHAGLTGRKAAVDAYGDFARHGAAALSGKDPSRIDRVGSYAARHIARNVVAAGLADKCEVQLSYAIGLARPVSVMISTFGTGQIDEVVLARRCEQLFDLRPAGIVRRFRLRSRPAQAKGAFFQRLAAYGHVGRDDIELPWEATDFVEMLRS